MRPSPRFLSQDTVLRLLFITAGGVAAVLFALEGNSEMIPGLIAGGSIGACLVAGFESEDRA